MGTPITRKANLSRKLAPRRGDRLNRRVRVRRGRLFEGLSSPVQGTRTEGPPSRGTVSGDPWAPRGDRIAASLRRTITDAETPSLCLYCVPLDSPTGPS